MTTSNPDSQDVRERSPADERAADREPREETDSDILGLVAKHDMNGAIRLLMQRHGTPVYRYCREALRDDVLAEDVQQQVFIAAFRDLPGFRQRSSVRTWLFAIARHRVLDAVKSRRRVRSHVAGDAALDVADPRPSALDGIDDARLREALRGCLDELAPRVRDALLLRFQQGFSFEDMSEICGMKSGTLQAQVARALPRLRACIERRIGGAT